MSSIAFGVLGFHQSVEIVHEYVMTFTAHYGSAIW